MGICLDNGFIRTRDGIFTKRDLLECLSGIGISRGDHICVHTSLPCFGVPLCNINEIRGPNFLGVFIDALSETIGETGTLLMPTFTYSFCRGEVFDVQNTPSTVGSLTEYFRKLAGTERTRDPIFSFALRGDMDYLDISNSCFGPGSVFDKLYKNGAKVIHLGADIGNGLTFMHYVERKFGVPYRYDKIFRGTVIDNGTAQEEEFEYYVRRLDAPSIISAAILREFLLEAGSYKTVPFAGGHIGLVDARRCCDDTIEKLSENPYFLLGEI
jgi:aminoglycoside 3-N-acetyltransferase